MEVDLGRALERVAEAIDGLPVVAAYVFGSMARREPARRDLDVALLIADDGPADAVLDTVARRLADLGPVRVAGRVLTDGLLAASTDEVARVRFEATTRSLALDFAPFAEAADRAYLAARAEGRAGWSIRPGWLRCSRGSPRSTGTSSGSRRWATTPSSATPTDWLR
jgi:predicted nucleotidyltransferase